MGNITPIGPSGTAGGANDVGGTGGSSPSNSDPDTLTLAQLIDTLQVSGAVELPAGGISLESWFDTVMSSKQSLQNAINSINLSDPETFAKVSEAQQASNGSNMLSTLQGQEDADQVDYEDVNLAEETFQNQGQILDQASATYNQSISEFNAGSVGVLNVDVNDLITAENNGDLTGYGNIALNYNDFVNSYNDSISTINQFIDTYNAAITTYNQAVDALNAVYQQKNEDITAMNEAGASPQLPLTPLIPYAVNQPIPELTALSQISTSPPPPSLVPEVPTVNITSPSPPQTGSFDAGSYLPVLQNIGLAFGQFLGINTNFQQIINDQAALKILLFLGGTKLAINPSQFNEKTNLQTVSGPSSSGTAMMGASDSSVLLILGQVLVSNSLQNLVNQNTAKSASQDFNQNLPPTGPSGQGAISGPGENEILGQNLTNSFTSMISSLIAAASTLSIPQGGLIANSLTPNGNSPTGNTVANAISFANQLSQLISSGALNQQITTLVHQQVSDPQLQQQITNYLNNVANRTVSLVATSTLDNSLNLKGGLLQSSILTGLANNTLTTDQLNALLTTVTTGGTAGPNRVSNIGPNLVSTAVQTPVTAADQTPVTVAGQTPVTTSGPNPVSLDTLNTQLAPTLTNILISSGLSQTEAANAVQAFLTQFLGGQLPTASTIAGLSQDQINALTNSSVVSIITSSITQDVNNTAQIAAQEQAAREVLETTLNGLLPAGSNAINSALAAIQANNLAAFQGILTTSLAGVPGASQTVNNLTTQVINLVQTERVKTAIRVGIGGGPNVDLLTTNMIRLQNQFATTFQNTIGADIDLNTPATFYTYVQDSQNNGTVNLNNRLQLGITYASALQEGTGSSNIAGLVQQTGKKEVDFRV